MLYQTISLPRPTYPEKSKTAEPITATEGGPLEANTLGATIPFVIGTGEVDGKFFIGGTSVVSIITGYSTVQVEDSIQFASYNSTSESTGGARYTSTIKPGVSVDWGPDPQQVPIYTTETVSSCGYILAYDPFERGYDLIRLEVDGKIVYDAENGIGAGLTFRFYGGRHTTVDPIIEDRLGANASAYQNFVMVFLEGYPSDSPPSVRAVISNAATDQPEAQEIAWTSATPGVFGEDSAGRQSAYDPVEGVIYHLLGSDQVTGSTSVYLAVLDTNTYAERYRVPLESSSDYVDQSMWVMAIRGSHHVFVRFADPSGPDVNRVYDANTGKLIVEVIEGSVSYDWKLGANFGSKYVLYGFSFGGDDLPAYALIDLAAETLEIDYIEGGVGGSPIYGRATAGTISFFVAGAGYVDESVFDGDVWSTTRVHTSSGTVTGAWYDSETGYLIVFETVGVDSFIRYVNPDTGAIIDSIDSDAYFISTGTFATGRERYWPRPGYVMMTDGVDDPGRVYLLNVQSQAITTFAEDLTLTNLEFTTGIFEHSTLTYYLAVGDDIWTAYKLPNSSPGLVDLDDIITDVMSLAGFTSGDLTFEGFSGLSTYGFVIQSDTNVSQVIQAVQNIFDFSFCDTGSGFVFKKPGRDGLFAIDATLTEEDLVDRDGGSVKSRDEANIRIPAKVEIEYISKTNYEVRPASFSMPTGVTNSIRTEKYSTPIIMTDLAAQQFATERFFDLQAKRRLHDCAVAPEHSVLLPGDIVVVPSDEQSYTTIVDEVAIDFLNMQVDLVLRDFQTSVSTTITAVSNEYSTTEIILFATQYIHLDIPLYRYSDDAGGLSLVQYGMLSSRGQTSWSGGLLYRGATVDTLALLVDQAPHFGFIGVCTTVLPDMPNEFAGDFTNSLTIQRIAGSTDYMESQSESEVLLGDNMAFVGVPGRWEGLGYCTVVDNGNGSFTVSDFAHRGWRGSEVHAGSHETGDLFVLIDPLWLHKAPLELADLDQIKFYKPVGMGQDPRQGVPEQHTITGTAETPYAPVNLDATIVGSDILFEWDYRNRLAAWEFFSAGPDSGEATLSFEIDIMDAGSPNVVARMLTSTTNSKTYLAADITTDFGGMPATITFRVYMISAAVDRGYVGEATITL